jgi:two-component sensor histidine kinase
MPNQEDAMTPNQEIIVTQVVPEVPCSEVRVLLQELDHRIINEFASAISAAALAVARTQNDEAKGALSAIAQLLHHHADVHRALQMPAPDTLVDAAAYLRQLCLSISRSKLDCREIRLVLVAESLRLESDRCWRLGMILHELINNAARHAFASGSSRIRVELAGAGAFVECKVLDNGAAAAGVQPGRGFKIISELAKGLDGWFEQTFGSRGSMFVITFPLELRMQNVITGDTPTEMAEIGEQTLEVRARAVGW